jgi:DNA-binding transcriptional LysR family regulator
VVAPGDLDWDDLRYLLRAAEAKTLAGAARAIGVRHTTIGRRLSALEHALGKPLVWRGPEGIKLTPLGESVVPLVEDMERTVLAIRDVVAAAKARVRLAMPSGFARIFTTRLGELGRDHPGIALELVSSARPVDLDRGEADLAIRSGPVVRQDWEWPSFLVLLATRNLPCDALRPPWSPRATLPSFTGGRPAFPPRCAPSLASWCRSSATTPRRSGGRSRQ